MIDYNPKRGFTLLFRWRGSVLPRIFFELLLASGFGFLAYFAANQGVTLVSLTDFLGGSAALASDSSDELLDSELHDVLILPIGFLLVVRSAIAYMRYWEARTYAGDMVHNTHEILRLIATYAEGDDEEAQVERAELRRLVNMLFAVARNQLEVSRPEARELSGESLSMITPNELRVLVRLTNRAAIVVQWLSFRLNESSRAGRISRNDARLVEARIGDFLRACAGAERIATTPLPYPFVQMVNLLCSLYVHSAPFTFAHRYGGFTPVLACFLALTLLGINAVASEIESPFGSGANDLPFDRYSAAVEEDSEMILRQRDPDTEKYEKFWGKRALTQRLLREGAAAAGAAPGGGGSRVVAERADP